MLNWIHAVSALFLLAGCAQTPRAWPPGFHPPSSDAELEEVNDVAPDYVRIQLEIGERDEGYVDAYYGPPELRTAARASPRTLVELENEVEFLRGRLIDIPPWPERAARMAFLHDQLLAAATRLRMLQGERLSFEDEAWGLYGVRPQLRPLADYDPILERIERLVPGTGPLADRVEAFMGRFTIPRDRLEPVMRAAIAECRRRTARHIDLPRGESFTLEFVTNQPWSGYNWYQGNYRSLIQINTDLPVRLSRAVDLGCHEGYPGHHVYNMLLERNLVRRRGWVEFTVYPLYSPQSFIAEGSANYGIDLAFPGNERLEFETRVLYPLAGLSTEHAAEYLALQKAIDELSGARFTIARDYLEGGLAREQAIELTRRYQLVSRARAEQSIAFTDRYRAYVINYGLGREMVARHIEAAGPNPEARWDRMERLLSEPTTPADLAPPGG